MKFLIAVTGSLLITSVTAFGMYGADGNDWINFLTHGNQFRARMEQLGFTLGNGTIKGTLGVKADGGWMGSILTGDDKDIQLNATVSAGIGYTSDMLGIGLGYNFTYIDKYLQVHTPTLVFNTLNNNLRLAIPIQVAVTDNAYGFGKGNTKFTGIGFNQIELRYYTGIDAFNFIRLDFSYKNGTWEQTSLGKGSIETFGMQLRLYFLNTQVGNVTVNPYIRIDYHQVLKGDYTLSQNGFSRDYLTIGDMYKNEGLYALGENETQSDIYDVSPFYLSIKPVLSLAASSDVVSVYFEPAIGYAVTSEKRKDVAQQTSHALTWAAYGELYITPVKDLEWYFELDVNGNVNGSTTVANVNLPPVLFETTTGITWYLPSLDGNTAQ
ncbi:cell surface protein [Brachyspira hampsonii]|uniref:cell surface protein n=1 Tax=Brachyspira hampsonii TaxID=1287055 RepID=UPI0005866D4A|nr:cell surface protein [Brachyspira hampsonii]